MVRDNVLPSETEQLSIALQEHRRPGRVIEQRRKVGVGRHANRIEPVFHRLYTPFDIGCRMTIEWLPKTNQTVTFTCPSSTSTG